ncbi:MAG: hypothetical protein ACD_49C00029G0014 [uncultured bacterium (gcode 4)]|uniref:CARDB domain-containing protein n=1 Tax=uncultured bacterium (gcode 4) TaxID=1234023 RepID=K2AXU1_9BACT|nr:MAG: hypothetical protein ACD_49C00029G0014 [uncultured bacterium (gcode 4)]
MRKLISLVFALALVIPNITSAAPFDIFNKYYPDFLISNIWQDNSSKDIYVKVCNAWWSVDSGTMQLWLKKSNWEKFTKTFQNVNIYNGGCVDYRAFSPSEISIASSGNYSLTVWIVIKSNRSEKNLANNISTRYVYINTSTTFYNNQYYNNSSYSSPTSNYNNQYNNNCNSSNYYWNPDLVVKEVWQDTYNNRIYAKICNIWANMSNSLNLRFDFILNGKTVEKYSYVNLNRDSCTSLYVNTTDFIQWYYNDNSVSVKLDVNNNLSESNENNNYFSQNINISCLRPDILIDNIIQNTNNNTLTVKVCNRWNSTLNDQNWSTKIYNNSNWNSVIRNHSINLWQNSCIDFNISYYEIWIPYNSYWYYEIKAETDIYNNIYESNEDNNSFVRGFNY